MVVFVWFLEFRESKVEAAQVGVQAHGPADRGVLEGIDLALPALELVLPGGQARARGGGARTAAQVCSPGREGAEGKGGGKAPAVAGNGSLTGDVSAPQTPPAPVVTGKAVDVAETTMVIKKSCVYRAKPQADQGPVYFAPIIT